jgi:hypothetical protein
MTAAVVLELAEARRELAALGLTREQMQQVTGMGHRRYPACGPDDTVEQKYAAGALSAHGVMGVVFGADSPQHHAGTAVGIDPLAEVLYWVGAELRHTNRDLDRDPWYQWEDGSTNIHRHRLEARRDALQMVDTELRARMAARRAAAAVTPVDARAMSRDRANGVTS